MLWISVLGCADWRSQHSDVDRIRRQNAAPLMSLPLKSAATSFNIADPESITIPRELRFALEANGTAMQNWNSLTAGKRRGFCYRVDSAKRMETRPRWVADIIEMLVSAR